MNPTASRAFLALGSNLGDKAANLADAAHRLDQAGIRIAAASSLWRTEPVGDVDQDWFLNQVLAVDTGLAPEALLRRCLEIEQAMGRVRTRLWGPRLIDIDLLLQGEIVCATPDLTLPHPRMTERAFVLAPLAELAPDLVLAGTPITALLAAVEDQGCVRYSI